jgi:hypothetical protein
MQGGYRIIDEGVIRPDKPPWSPVSLFWLTFWFGPVGALMFVLNWGRLGQPEKRWRAAGMAAAVLLLPMIVMVILLIFGQPLEQSVHRFIGALTRLLLAYYFLGQQQPAFRLQLLQGGRKGSTLMVWIACLAVSALWLWLLIQRTIVESRERPRPLPPLAPERRRVAILPLTLVVERQSTSAATQGGNAYV